LAARLQGRGYALGVGEETDRMVRPCRKWLTYRSALYQSHPGPRRLTMGVADAFVEADGEVIYQRSKT